MLQRITLTYPCGDQTTYVDQVGTEDAAESYFMLDEHRADGDTGSIEIGHFVPFSREDNT